MNGNMIIRIKRKRDDESTDTVVIDAPKRSRAMEEDGSNLVFCRVATVPIESESNTIARALQHPRQRPDTSKQAMREQYHDVGQTSKRLQLEFLRSTHVVGDGAEDHTVVDAHVAPSPADLTCNYMPLVREVLEMEPEEDDKFVYDIYSMMEGSVVDPTAALLSLPEEFVMEGDESEEDEYDSNAENHPGNDYPDEMSGVWSDDYDDEIDEYL